MKGAFGLVICLLLSACGGGGGNSGVGTSGSDAVRPPSADAGVDQRVVEQTEVALDGTASRGGNQGIASYAWAQLLGSVVGLRGAESVRASFTAPQVEQETVLQFRLTVTDSAGSRDTDSVQVIVVPVTHRVGGTITAAQGVDVDGDVNDPAAPLAANDAPAEAQTAANPATIGGYLNVAGSGEPGRSQAGGDLSDFYRVLAVADQTIALRVSDPVDGDPDLHLWDASGTKLLDSSVETGPTETVTVPATAEVLVEVSAFRGASNYTLIIGHSGGVQSAGLHLGADFVPGEIVLARRVSKSGPDAAAERLQALGVRTASPAVGRPVLARLEDDVPGVVGPQSRVAGSRAAAIADPQRRHKYRTLMAVKALLADPDIAWAHPNYRVRAQEVPNDPFYHLQWHYPLIDLPAAWDVTVGEPGVRVAVIDTGVLMNHPDLAPQLEPGYDFISDPLRADDGDGIDGDADDPGDGNGVERSSFHGTHVAGTVAAASNNDQGVAGVAHGVRVVPLRVLGRDGGTAYDVIQAARYAAGLPNDSGIQVPPVDVINLSLGAEGPCAPGYQQAVEDARAQGVIVVVAAGNNGRDVAGQSPANCNGVVAVGAVDLLGEPAYYSNFGPLLDVWAPGGDLTVDRNGDGYGDGVLSLLGDDQTAPPEHVYGFNQGTSMAAPHVAGVIGLMRTVNPALTPDEVDQLLVDGAMTDGSGLINAYAAVSAAAAAVGMPPELNPTLTVSPTSLNFGAASTFAEIEVRISGGGTLAVSEPSVSDGWITVTPTSAVSGNVGRYRVAVTRADLAEGTYSGTITVDSDRNQAEVQVIMQVSGDGVEADAGHLYVLLLDGESRDVVDFLALDAVAGKYSYEFREVRPGAYEIIAGTDFDNDDFICDAGESCGRYPILDQRRLVTVDGDVDDVDFAIGHVIPIAGSAQAEPTSRSAGVLLRAPAQ